MARFKKIYVEITNVCNLHCAFCPVTKRPNRFMTVTEFEHTIKNIKPYTNLIALHVKGEPLLHPNLKEILDICTIYNIQVNITTNATLLLENIEILKNSPAVRQINLSIHSVKQNNGMDELNYLNNIFSAVDTLQETNNKNKIYISYRLWNLKNISENDENFNVISILQDKYNINNLLAKCKLNDFIKLDDNVFLNQDKTFIWPTINSTNNNNDININKKRSGTCQGLRSQIAILSNGDVVPCCLDQDANIKLGNIFEEDFENIISSKLSQNIIEGFKNNILLCDLCQNCDYIKKFK